MKKINIVIIFLLGVVISISAQGINGKVENKKEIPVLPVAGDFAIGLEANPFLSYIGNLFNGSTDNTSPSVIGLNQTIYGKYFMTENTAIRVKLGFDFGTDMTAGTAVIDDNDPLNILNTVVDYKYDKKRDLMFNIGYEGRRGFGRLQGFMGGEVGFGFTNNIQTYQYGNQMTVANQTPTTSDFSGNELHPNVRVMENNLGSIIKGGVNGFIGAEYFFAPKISIGGEMGLGIYGNSGNFGKTKSQQYNPSEGEVIEQSHRVGQIYTNKLHFSTTPTGKLFLLFHF